jgi:hypothetical protein
MSNGQVPRDDNDVPSLGLWDSTGHQIVPAQAVSVATDSSGQKYGVMNVSASFSAASLAINDPTTTTQKAGVNAGGSLQVAGQGTAGTAAGGVVSIQGVASGTVVPISGTITANAGTNLNTSLLALETGGNLASAKADLDTVVTNTTSIATAANQTTGNTNTANTATGIGGVADSAYTSGSGSIIAIVKGTFTRLANIVTMAFDNTSRLQTSLYGKNSAAGDTAILVDSTGRTLTGRSTVAVFTQASAATSGSTQNSGDLTVGSYTEISIDINTTAQSGTSPTIQYFYERKGADGIYYVLWQSAVLTAAANTISTSIGAGMAYNQSLGVTGRLHWVVGGSATPTYTMSINIYGK